MAPPIRRGRAAAVQRALGVVFLGVLAGLVWLTGALYQQTFRPTLHVTLLADHAGNQLSRGADVKVRGIVIGRVRSVTSTGDGARLALDLRPDQARLLTTTATARLLPKTLFGEKEVVLVPAAGSGRPLRDGDVLDRDRTAAALETEQVLDDLLPLLQAVQPDQIAVTLNALSTSLRGRGERLGANLERTDAYLARFNPLLPQLRRDLTGPGGPGRLATTRRCPTCLTFLANSAVTSRTLADAVGGAGRLPAYQRGVRRLGREPGARQPGPDDRARRGEPAVAGGVRPATPRSSPAC